LLAAQKRIARGAGEVLNRLVRYEPIPSQLFIGNRDRLRGLLKPNSIVLVRANDIYPTMPMARWPSSRTAICSI
jgi:hypothetical protein